MIMDKEYKKQRLREVDEYINNKKKKEEVLDTIIEFAFILILIFAALVTCYVFFFYLRYKYLHPELTQTQLELALWSKFCWYRVLILASFISSICMKFMR